MRRRLALIAVALLVVTGWLGLRPYARAAAFIARVTGLEGPVASRLAGLGARSFTTADLVVPTRQGGLLARVYVPDATVTRAIVLTPGVHAEGIDEFRLVGLARQAAASGLVVLTPELPDLLDYGITPALPDAIEDVALWLASQPRYAPDGRVGLVGISFAGGLSIVAAGRPSLDDRLAFTLSFGGHGDLGRVLRYLCTGIQPSGWKRPPHDYGVAVILMNAAPRLVPPDQVDGLREGIRTFLHASHLDMTDKARAADIFARARAMEETLAEPARTLLGLVNARDVATLGPRLLPVVDGVSMDAALSPERSRVPVTPVYLLHGTDDNVVPAIESTMLAAHLRRSTRVRLLVTPLITHAEVDRSAGVDDIVALVAFWAEVLRQ